MLTIALTGNIGSGKSTVADMFAVLGAPVVDTDQLAREAVLPRSEALAQIVSRFGEEILLEDGKLNRKKLREKIFETPSERLWLENLLHPLIREKAKTILQSLDAPYALYVVPLFVGRGDQRDFIHRVLLVDAPLEIQKSRVMARDQMNAETFETILAAQAARDALLKAADDVIVNDHNLEHLKAQVLQLDQRYRSTQKI